jgi:hypothetical protein
MHAPCTKGIVQILGRERIDCEDQDEHFMHNPPLLLQHRPGKLLARVRMADRHAPSNFFKNSCSINITVASLSDYVESQQHVQKVSAKESANKAVQKASKTCRKSGNKSANQDIII